MLPNQVDSEVVLAAEDCDSAVFRQISVFSSYEEDILRRLVSHGPVLLKGARGSGKSTLLREAALRLQRNEVLGANAVGVYISLRHLPLLTSKEREYESIFYRLLIPEVARSTGCVFAPHPETSEVQHALSELSVSVGKRIVLLFDDAAHIGREAPRTEFFDLYSTLPGSSVSCKAAIYPGVTNFGLRFDVYNDATVIDLSRNEEHVGFREFFSDVMAKRYDSLVKERFVAPLDREAVADFIGRLVLGNVRSFVYVCNRRVARCEREPRLRVGLNQLSETLIDQAREYFWPLLDEVKPKLGKYELMIEPAGALADGLYKKSAGADARSVVVLREHVERLAKPFEILEYAGFIARREASRAMKSSGRGTRFVLNLCNLLEQMAGSRLTEKLFLKWMEKDREPLELHRGSEWLKDIPLPGLSGDAEISVLSLPIDQLTKSQAYPYGLTAAKVDMLHRHGFDTIRDLALASKDALDALPGVGERWVDRIRALVGQAIWM